MITNLINLNHFIPYSQLPLGVLLAFITLIVFRVFIRIYFDDWPLMKSIFWRITHQINPHYLQHLPNQGHSISVFEFISKYILISKLYLKPYPIPLSKCVRNSNKLTFTLLFLFFSPLFLMSQTYKGEINDSAKNITLIKVNTMYMNQLNVMYPCLKHEKGFIFSECTLADTANPMGPDYYLYDVSADNYLKTKRRMRFNYGLNLQIEQYRNPRLQHSDVRYNVFPYVGFDGETYFGWRLGLHMGNIYIDEPENQGRVNFWPGGKFWFGHKDYATMQFSLFDSEIAGPFNSILDIKFNCNLRKVSNMKLGQTSIGYSLNLVTNSFYAQSEIYLRPNLTLSPRVGQVIKVSPYKGENQYGFMGGLGFRYNFVNHQ